MTPYFVNVVAKAERDAETIFDWLAARSPAGARRWAKALNAAYKKLAENPVAYGQAPERVRPSVKIRQIFFKTPKGKRYRAVFTVVGQEVRVLRIRRPHQRVMRRRDMPGI